MCRREVKFIYYHGENQHIGVGFKVRAIASHLQPRCTHLIIRSGSETWPGDLMSRLTQSFIDVEAKFSSCACRSYHLCLVNRPLGWVSHGPPP